MNLLPSKQSKICLVIWPISVATLICVSLSPTILNPDGFAYGNQDNEYVYYFSNPAYFLSSYSKSNYKEDRAVIFADMMFRSLKKDYYTNGNPINEKAKLISKQLDSYFDCVSSSVTETWERFIEWWFSKEFKLYYTYNLFFY